MALPACRPEESSVKLSLPAKIGNTQFLQYSAPEFANILKWETTHERTATTENPITNSMHQRVLHDAVSALHGTSTWSVPYHRDTDFFSPLNAIGRHWEGPLKSLSAQEKSNRTGRWPSASSERRPSSRRQRAGRRWSRPETIKTAIKRYIEGTDSYPQEPSIRSSHELHTPSGVRIAEADRHQEMAKRQAHHTTHQDRPRNSEPRMSRH